MKGPPSNFPGWDLKASRSAKRMDFASGSGPWVLGSLGSRTQQEIEPKELEICPSKDSAAIL